MARTTSTCTGAMLLAAMAIVCTVQESAAANIAAGEAKVKQLCAECHRPRDWNGETTAALQALITDIVAGKVKHSRRKLELTPQEIADIAAYWTSGRK